MAAILDSVKHPYLPYKEPERLAFVSSYGGGGREITVADWREALQSASFVEGMTFTAGAHGLVETGSYSGERLMTLVTPDFFSFLGLKPLSGRFPGTAAADDDAAVISDELRRVAFPGDKSPIGATVSVEDRTYTIVGVAPAGVDQRSELWLPLASYNPSVTSPPRLSPLIRIRAGSSPDAVRQELQQTAKRLDASYGGGPRPVILRLDPQRRDPLRFRPFHAALAAAGLIVLLVAGGNVANLLLARSMERRPEQVLRVALGAKASDVARATLLETLVVAIVGCIVGVLLAIWCMNIVAVYRPTGLQWLGTIDPRLSWRVVAYAAGAAIVLAVASSIGPLTRIARVDPGEVLKTGAATMTRVARRRDSLVILQLALALVLLFCAGLLAKSALNIQRYDFGYDATPLVHADIMFPPGSINADSAFRELVVHAAALPGVTKASFEGSAGLPGGAVTADEHEGPRGSLIKRSVSIVEPNFFRTLGVPVIAGRDFQPGDVQAGAAIVDLEVARKLWRGDSVIDRALKLGDHESTGRWVRVVGVVRMARFAVPSDPHMPPEPGVFVVLSSLPSSGSIVVRTASPAATANGLRYLLRDHLRLGGRRYLARVEAWTADVESRVEARWFMSALFAVFAAFTLLLALVGMYGTLSYSVSRRMREFGVRSALGATSIELRKLILAQAAIAILAATAIGGPAGMVAGRLLDSWLYDVWYSDVAILLIAEAVLVSTSFVVSMPAMHRVRSLDPSRLLKEL